MTRAAERRAPAAPRAPGAPFGVSHRRLLLHAELRDAFAVFDHTGAERTAASGDEAAAAFARRGWRGLDVPSSLGGLGRDAEAGAVLAYELGWAARWDGWLDGLFLCDVLDLTGAPGHRLGPAGTGAVTAALAAVPGARAWFDGAATLEPHGPGRALRLRTAHRYTTVALHGPTTLVIPALQADGRRLALLDSRTVGTRRERDGGLELHGLVLDPDDVLPRPADGAWHGLVTRSRLRFTAALLGLTARALREALRAGDERVQFGTPVLHNQALSFDLADLSTDLVAARHLLWTHCARRPGDEPPPAHRAAEQCADASRLALKAAARGAHISGARSMRPDATTGRIRRLAAVLAAHAVHTLTAEHPAGQCAGAPGPAAAPVVHAGHGKGGDRALWDGLHSAFYRQAARTPEAPAVITSARTFSYREVAARADALAAELVTRRLPPETRVALALSPGRDLVCAMLAVLRCGLAFLPLETGQPPHRATEILRVAAPPVVLADAAGAHLLRDATETLVRTDAVSGDSDGRRDPGPGPVRPAHPDALAYVMFTSGSTGRPKGVLVSHRALAHRLLWDREHEPLGPKDTVLSHTPAGFDPFLWEIFAPLTSGAAVYVADEAERMDLTRLSAAIVGRGVTALTLLPGTLAELLRSAPEGVAAPFLRLIHCGGEQLPLGLARAVREHSGARLYNCYGLTETAIDACVGEFTGVDDSAGDTGVLLGCSVPGTRLTVLHDDGSTAHPGVPGQLGVCGAVLARGYLDDPRLTALRFRPDPTGAAPGARVFLTGDTVRLFRGGRAEFIGRRDGELKILGHRFHPADVETALRAAPGVAEAFVGLTGGPKAPRLTAAVTLSDGGALPGQDSASSGTGSGDASNRTSGPGALRAHLLTRLPRPMVPSRIVVLPYMPLLPSGKADRRAALEAAAAPTPAPVDGDAAPMAHHETLECAVALVAEALGLPQDHSLDADFFALGGDSLSAVRIIRTLERDTNLSVDVGALFAASSVMGLLHAAAGTEDSKAIKDTGESGS